MPLGMDILAHFRPFDGTNAGSTLYVCETVLATAPANAAAYAALTWVKVAGVGSISEMGIQTNILSYDSWDGDVVRKQKGMSNAGDPTVEVARLPDDPGQDILRAQSRKRTCYAFKIERDDAPEPDWIGTTIYNWGIVTGPTRPMGRNEDFDLEVFTLGFMSYEVVVDPVQPWWVPGAIGGWDFEYNRYMRNGINIPSASAFSFSRSSTALNDNLLGDLTQFPIDALRIGPKGALIEPLETNILASGYDLNAWTQNTGAREAYPGPALGILTGGQIIRSTGGAFNRLRCPIPFAVTNGVPVYFREIALRGPTPSNRMLVQFENASGGATSAVTGLITSLANSTTVIGPITDIATETLAGVDYVSGKWVPNYTGTAYKNLGPNSSVSGQDIIVLGGQVSTSKCGSPILSLGTRSADVLDLISSGTMDFLFEYDNGEQEFFLGNNNNFLTDPVLIDRSHIIRIYSFIAGQILLNGLDDIPLGERVN